MDTHEAISPFFAIYCSLKTAEHFVKKRPWGENCNFTRRWRQKILHLKREFFVLWLAILRDIMLSQPALGEWPLFSFKIFFFYIQNPFFFCYFCILTVKYVSFNFPALLVIPLSVTIMTVDVLWICIMF